MEVADCGGYIINQVRELHEEQHQAADTKGHKDLRILVQIHKGRDGKFRAYQTLDGKSIVHLAFSQTLQSGRPPSPAVPSTDNGSANNSANLLRRPDCREPDPPVYRVELMPGPPSNKVQESHKFCVLLRP